MKKLTLAIVLLGNALLWGCAQQPESVGDVADTVYTNGKIYTVNEAQPWAEAVAIQDGKFLVVGSNADVEAVTGDATEVVDLGGAFAMPGLIDPHTHMMAVPVDRVNIQLENPDDKDAILEQIRSYAEANPDVPYVRGAQWNLGVFPDNSPRKEWLDEIVPDRPVYLYSQTGHDAWVNSKTIELIDLENREQDGRHVWDVDPQTGEPSGTIREWTMGLVEQALEPPAPESLIPDLVELVASFNAHGFTSLKEAGAQVWTVRAANLLDNEGGLDIRLFPAWHHMGHMAASSRKESLAVAADWASYESPRVYPRYMKMYADGASNSHSALLLEDYSDRPGFKGEMPFPYETYVEDFSHFNKLGLGMIVHVYGDGTSEKVIEAFEEVRRRNGDNGIPLHFSHSFMTTADQIERLAEIPDVSIDFITLQYPHDAVKGNFQPTIGEERYQQWINARSAAKAGIPFGFGSDWPAAINPVLNGFREMQGFVTRRDPLDPDSGTLNASEALTLEQAVYGFTQGGAYTLGFDWPEKLGSIEEGKLADFIVVDRDIFEIPIGELHETRVERTVVDGEVVYERN